MHADYTGMEAERNSAQLKSDLSAASIEIQSFIVLICHADALSVVHLAAAERGSCSAYIDTTDSPAGESAFATALC